MSANVSSDGTVRPLDRPAQPVEGLAEKDVRETSLLLKWLLNVLRRLAGLERRWSPRRVDFEGVRSTGTTGAAVTLELQHNIGGEVRWWVVDVQSPGAITTPFVYRINAGDPNVLSLRCYYTATLTVRVEEAGS